MSVTITHEKKPWPDMKQIPKTLNKTAKLCVRSGQAISSAHKKVVLFNCSQSVPLQGRSLLLNSSSAIGNPPLEDDNHLAQQGIWVQNSDILPCSNVTFCPSGSLDEKQATNTASLSKQAGFRTGASDLGIHERILQKQM
jgi:hypothetical protein